MISHMKPWHLNLENIVQNAKIIIEGIKYRSDLKI